MSGVPPLLSLVDLWRIVRAQVDAENERAAHAVRAEAPSAAMPDDPLSSTLETAQTAPPVAEAASAEREGPSTMQDVHDVVHDAPTVAPDAPKLRRGTRVRKSPNRLRF